MNMYLIFCAVLIVCIILTSVTATFSILAYAKVVGMEKSTHQVQWMPLDPSADDDSIEDPVQDGKKPKEPEVISQFKKMYPDIDLEQV